ncbi:MAG: hypothetical protein AAFU53_08060, partial [Cyanobacteria bacterium J06632_3]
RYLRVHVKIEQKKQRINFIASRIDCVAAAPLRPPPAAPPPPSAPPKPSSPLPAPPSSNGQNGANPAQSGPQNARQNGSHPQRLAQDVQVSNPQPFGDTAGRSSTGAGAVRNPRLDAPTGPGAMDQDQEKIKRFANFFNGQIVNLDDDTEDTFGGSAKQQSSDPGPDVPF